jgi:hypothetical protein
MRDAELSELGLAEIEELVRQSEIDFRTLRRHLQEALASVSQITVGQLLERYPAELGFGSVVGYLSRYTHRVAISTDDWWLRTRTA